MDISIKNIPPETVKKLEEAAAKDGVSRNALIVKILADYAACRDDFVVNSLPLIVRSMVNEELEKLVSGVQTAENNIYLAALKLMKTAEKLDFLLAPELKKAGEKTISNEDILNVINSLEK